MDDGSNMCNLEDDDNDRDEYTILYHYITI